MITVSLRNGDVDPVVVEIRQRLSRLGLLSDQGTHPSEVFDDQLLEAVRIFQQSRGLTIDGIIGPQTYRRLEEAHWILGDRILTYMPGKMIHGEDVATLQHKLQELGFHLDRLDGVFGPQTDRAVREFQRSVGLSDDGTCGPAVFAAFARLARTVTGGSQEHLRDLAALEAQHTIESASILLDISDSATPLAGSNLTIGEICWDIATRLEGRLAAAGSLVILSRAQNSARPDEQDCARLANDQKVDLVVSLHLDVCPDAQANGIATSFFGHNLSRSAMGARLAETVQQEIANRTALKDCRTHARTWDLLRLTKMPAVQIDLGYASNVRDSEILSNAQQRDAISSALAVSIGRVLAVRIG
ncbi:MAG: N-acetylmuramoyl-L-alanine amidase [Actinobacteria bacterium]|nr:N-acetylmuramoyl-L-alanine amidase [Actinomycetota bacterium]